MMKKSVILFFLAIGVIFSSCKDNVYGTYTGEAIGMTYSEDSDRTKGNVVFELEKSSNDANTVKGILKWDKGLVGKATVFGKLNGAKLNMEGVVYNNNVTDDIKVDCEFSKDFTSINCNYYAIPTDIDKTGSFLGQKGKLSANRTALNE